MTSDKNVPPSGKTAKPVLLGRPEAGRAIEFPKGETAA